MQNEQERQERPNYLNTVLLTIVIGLGSWNLLQTHNTEVEVSMLKASMISRQEVEVRLTQMEVEIADIHVALANKGMWPR